MCTGARRPRLPDDLGEFAEDTGGPLTLTTLTGRGQAATCTTPMLAAMTTALHYVTRRARATRRCLVSRAVPST
ncbi:hypothetical protein [Streptomyces sp. NBC_01304]|uniref:hypothetical protein n=1 Tax=Streptomyces sp. NBC_01304 TaxID=2903818 RepID=UPI002E12367B|nr:hypothetical protein OG430_01160 [Streptomyces sp. NBC_01304]